jgi:hypothetical protein
VATGYTVLFLLFLFQNLEVAHFGSNQDNFFLLRIAPNPRPIDLATLPRRNHTACLLLGAVLKTSAREHLLPSGRDLNRRQSPNLYFVCGRLGVWIVRFHYYYYFVSAAGASKIVERRCVPPLYSMETILPADVAVGRELVARQGQHGLALPIIGTPARAVYPSHDTRTETRRAAEARSLPQSPCSPALPLHLDEPTRTE